MNYVLMLLFNVSRGSWFSSTSSSKWTKVYRTKRLWNHPVLQI